MLIAIGTPRCSRSIKENIINWWYINTNIFNFTFEISIFHFWIVIQIFTFTSAFRIEFTLPQLWNCDFKNIFCKSIELTKNKVSAIQFRFTNSLTTGIAFYENIHCDHAGINLEISILGLTIIFHIQNKKHWDDEKYKVKYECISSGQRMKN
jgi:hypothetical protein